MLLSYAKVLALSVEIVSCCKIDTYSKTMVRSKTGGLGWRFWKMIMNMAKYMKLWSFIMGNKGLRHHLWY